MLYFQELWFFEFKALTNEDISKLIDKGLKISEYKHEW